MPAKATDRFGTAVTFEMPGATWDYVNELHAQYRFHENWPNGMLCHITGEVDEGIRSIGLWRNRELEQEYFRRVAVEVITDSIRDLGPPPVDAEAENFEPRAASVSGVLLTELCTAFADIGEDSDGRAINALGTEPVIATLPCGDADYLDHAPEGLIIAWTTEGPDGCSQHQVWAASEHASGGEIHPLRRISFGLSELMF
ncbi:MAG: hypothetical protein JHC98_07995 [Thermoleophilaceae bacterium]|nr:hypothetical protein [Thermoleophilaceae bacterium]